MQDGSGLSLSTGESTYKCSRVASGSEAWTRETVGGRAAPLDYSANRISRVLRTCTAYVVTCAVRWGHLVRWLPIEGAAAVGSQPDHCYCSRATSSTGKVGRYAERRIPLHNQHHHHPLSCKRLRQKGIPPDEAQGWIHRRE